MTTYDGPRPTGRSLLPTLTNSWDSPFVYKRAQNARKFPSAMHVKFTVDSRQYNMRATARKKPPNKNKQGREARKARAIFCIAGTAMQSL